MTCDGKVIHDNERRESRLAWWPSATAVGGSGENT